MILNEPFFYLMLVVTYDKQEFSVVVITFALHAKAGALDGSTYARCAASGGAIHARLHTATRQRIN